ncbi:hypothetical protein PanWU01x14_071110 [Parasponia andersonii]|uniref:Uncharacterized protein n=1 Tax=Parasponia andersonii TaxID=3476 RepID=A0A2P5DEB9_PARAD|nr:hypothetical protein PanWU01x14_071110 [Parasponia andersonii]
MLSSIEPDSFSSSSSTLSHFPKPYTAAYLIAAAPAQRPHSRDNSTLGVLIIVEPRGCEEENPENTSCFT